MKKIILLACLSAILSQYASAEKWKYITRDEDGSFYLDQDRIIKKASTVNYWTKFIAEKDNEELDFKQGDYIISQNIDRCDDRTTYSAVVEEYLKDGQLLNRELQDGDQVFTVDEDQTDLAFFNTVCK